jgi:hypothetical protein
MIFIGGTLIKEFGSIGSVGQVQHPKTSLFVSSEGIIKRQKDDEIG